MMIITVLIPIDDAILVHAVMKIVVIVNIIMIIINIITIMIIAVPIIMMIRINKDDNSKDKD